MNYLFCIFVLLLGMILGSFYNVVGWRLPKGESIIYPPSHCPNCNHQLKILDLIPVFSFILQRGKCRYCKNKIAWYYPVFEFLCGVIFMLCYLVFGITPELLKALTFVSMLIIIMVSDFNYMIIPDEVLLFFGCLLALEIGIIDGYKVLISSLINGLIAFVVMYLLKTLGDFMFKKESMGGGDIKLMFIFGLVLGAPLAIISIFIGSLVGLPISLILLSKNSEHIVPFGPYLSIGAIIILLLNIDFNTLINFLSH